MSPSLGLLLCHPSVSWASLLPTPDTQSKECPYFQDLGSLNSCPPTEALSLLAFHQACPLPGASVCSPLVASSAPAITVKEV